MNFFDISFWQGFVGNLFATILGVALGIPIAFWINKRVETATEKEKKFKILSVLLDELMVNNATLKNWNGPREFRDNERSSYARAQSNDMNTALLGINLGDEKWRAFSDGGELQWIKDQLILIALAESYQQITSIKYISNHTLTTALHTTSQGTQHDKFYLIN